MEFGSCRVVAREWISLNNYAVVCSHGYRASRSTPYAAAARMKRIHETATARQRKLEYANK